MENLNVNPTLAEGDLLELSPMKLPNSILKPSQKDNLIMLQTPVHKHLKVSFITPKRTPAQTSVRAPLGTISTNILQDDGGVNESCSLGTENAPKMGILTPNLMGNVASGNMPALKKNIVPRRPGLSSQDAIISNTEQLVSNDDKNVSRKQSTADNKWESLRKLDENLRWRERVEVITKLDHEEYTQCAKDYIGEMIDKAVDISVANSNQEKPNFTTLITKVVTPISRIASNDANIISPIAKSAPTKPEILTPGSEVMTPITKNATSMSNSTVGGTATEFNNTFDVSAHGSFLVENGKDAKIPKIEAAEKELVDVPKPKNTGLKPPSGLKKPSSVRPKQKHLTNARSHSVSDTCQNVIGKTDSIQDYKNASRSYSFDLGNIPEDFDPFLPSNTLKEGNDTVAMSCERKGSVANTTVDGNMSGAGSVFEMSTQATSFALRPIDSAFCDADFTDSSKLLEHGHLDLDYLEQKTSGNVSADLRKQSLYMKFDPLLEGLSSRQSLVLLGRKSDIIDFTGRVTPVPEDVAEEATVSPREPDLLCDSPSQIGAENVTFDNSHIQRGSASDSVGSASPSLQNFAHFKPDGGIIEVLKYSEEDIQRVLKRKKDKWAKERDEYESRCAELKNTVEMGEVLVKDFETRCEEAQSKATENDKKVSEEILTLKGEKQRIDAEILNITSKSSALLQRTETLQKISTNLQANEQKQKEHAKGLRSKYALSQRKIIELETELAQNLKKISREKSAIEASHTTQMSSIQAKIRAVELRMKSLQTTLDRKKNENKELLQICDELLANSEAH